MRPRGHRGAAQERAPAWGPQRGAGRQIAGAIVVAAQGASSVPVTKVAPLSQQRLRWLAVAVVVCLLAGWAAPP